MLGGWRCPSVRACACTRAPRRACPAAEESEESEELDEEEVAEIEDEMQHALEGGELQPFAVALRGSGSDGEPSTSSSKRMSLGSTPGSHEFARGSAVPDESYRVDDGDDEEEEDRTGLRDSSDEDEDEEDSGFVKDTSFLRAAKRRNARALAMSSSSSSHRRASRDR